MNSLTKSNRVKEKSVLEENCLRGEPPVFSTCFNKITYTIKYHKSKCRVRLLYFMYNIVYTLNDDKYRKIDTTINFSNTSKTVSATETYLCTVSDNEYGLFAILWSKSAIFRGAWQNVDMQLHNWALAALIPHIRAFKRGT